MARRNKWKSDLEDKLLAAWKKEHPKIPIETQHRFHPTRRWRFDFAFPAIYLAIEVQGYGHGHASYMGMATDYEKHNEAIRHGWVVMYFMAHDLERQAIRKTLSYIHNTIILRSNSIGQVQSYANTIKPKSTTPQEMFERMKNAKSYQRRTSKTKRGTR